MKKIKFVCLFLFIFSMIFLTGCWNYREIENLGIVSGLAIDKGKQGFKYHITFEVYDFAGSTAKGNAKPKLLESEGNTIFDAVKNMNEKSDKKLFFSDCKTVVISNEIAAEGITPLLDWFERDAQPRISLNLTISKGKTATEILKIGTTTSEIISNKISNMIEKGSAYVGKIPNTKFYQTYNILNGQGSSLVLPAIQTVDSTTGKTLELSDTAIFKKDKLIDFLSDDESKFLFFVTNNIKGGILLVDMGPEKDNVSLEISQSQTKITPVILNNNITMKIDIKTIAVMGEEDASGGKSSENAIEDVQKIAEKQLTENVRGLVEKAQKKYDSDILGFGTTIYNCNQTYWKKAKPNWNKLFSSLKFSITAKVKIDGTATAKIKKAGEE